MSVVFLLSLSARRAWIEIYLLAVLAGPSGVALRKESVDRNVLLLLFWCIWRWSLSARRAWIEIGPAISVAEL